VALRYMAKEENRSNPAWDRGKGRAKPKNIHENDFYPLNAMKPHRETPFKSNQPKPTSKNSIHVPDKTKVPSCTRQEKNRKSNQSRSIDQRSQTSSASTRQSTSSKNPSSNPSTPSPIPTGATPSK
jgi:hypothetical protein